MYDCISYPIMAYGTITGYEVIKKKHIKRQLIATERTALLAIIIQKPT